MARLDIRAIIERLNRGSRLAIEEAGSLCVSRYHREVTIEHFLFCLLGQPGNDIRVILQENGLSPDQTKEAVEGTFARLRQSEADRTPTFSPLLLDLLQDAWIVASVQLKEPTIRSGAVLIAMLSDPGRYLDFSYYNLLETLSAEDILKRFETLTAGSVETQGTAGSGGQAGSHEPDTSDSALSRYGTNFTELARNGGIDPVFCRDAEIRQIIEILCRRRKNNPICVGEAGVGKTALAEGFALKIAEGNVPEPLKGVEVWGLDIGALQAGASMKGEFEKRLKAVIDEVKASPTPIVLFIDEAHTLIGAGGDKGGSDAANLLKPALARGELKTIAATTWSEYKQYFEKDPALTRRFQLIKLDEPTVDEAVIILRGLKAAYEKAHGVYITEAALEAAARLSARYITGRQLPDKALDVIDTACARVSAARSASPPVLQRHDEERAALLRERDGLRRDRALGSLAPEQSERLTVIEIRLGMLDDEIGRMEKEFSEQSEIAGALLEQRRSLLEAGPGDDTPPQSGPHQAGIAEAAERFSRIDIADRMVPVDVGAAEIAAVIGDWTGIPVTSMAADDYQKLLSLAETMGQTIRGQDHALKAIEERLRASRLDLHRKGQPLGVFFLAGPSGVGKTETALEIARQLFGGEQFLTTINMSEYQERHTISRLIGSPPGYVGYGEGGILTEAIRKKPYSVVLLDEVEKADANVLNLFYQAFDKGELADGEGRAIDCKNVVFFLTSNLGSDQIENWVTTAEDGKTPSAETMARSLQPVFAQHFKPALLARMQPIVYLPLSEAIMAEIVDMKLGSLKELLADSQRIALTVTETAAARIRSMCGFSSNGARFVDQIIQRQLLPTISLEILEAGQQGIALGAIIVDYDEEHGFSFETIAREEARERSPQLADGG
ncbi:MAG: type VI secretion system ATPase TssH [Rhizobiaceae bacterium]|nr:type VI secretion system ATPase TssH [Rhizobiaceae bacterium]